MRCALYNTPPLERYQDNKKTSREGRPTPRPKQVREYLDCDVEDFGTVRLTISEAKACNGRPEGCSASLENGGRSVGETPDIFSSRLSSVVGQGDKCLRVAVCSISTDVVAATAGINFFRAAASTLLTPVNIDCSYQWRLTYLTTISHYSIVFSFAPWISYPGHESSTIT
nr:hypothetical transcript [Hymenolepis microstoma]